MSTLIGAASQDQAVMRSWIGVVVLAGLAVTINFALTRLLAYRDLS